VRTPLASKKESTMALAIADVVVSENTPIASTTAAPPVRRRRYRGGFHTSICDIFRDPHRRTDCCAVACCGVLSSDRSLFLLTGERPPPLWRRVLTLFIVPAVLFAAMNYFSTDVTVMDDDGQPQTLKVVSGRLLMLFIAYVIAILCLGFGVSDRFCLLVCWGRN
jgi:hypothetical protein